MSKSKGTKTAYVPTNAEAISLARQWKEPVAGMLSYVALERMRDFADRLEAAEAERTEFQAAAWAEGANWAAIECGVKGQFLAPGDNPYERGPSDSNLLWRVTRDTSLPEQFEIIPEPIGAGSVGSGKEARSDGVRSSDPGQQLGTEHQPSSPARRHPEPSDEGTRNA